MNTITRTVQIGSKNYLRITIPLNKGFNRGDIVKIINTGKFSIRRNLKISKSIIIKFISNNKNICSRKKLLEYIKQRDMPIGTFNRVIYILKNELRLLSNLKNKEVFYKLINN